MKAKDIANVRTSAQLQHFLNQKRTKGESAELAALLESDFELSKRIMTLCASSRDPQTVRAYSPIFCLLSPGKRAKLIRLLRPYEGKDFIIFVGNLPAKGLRCFIRSLDLLGSADDAKLCLMRMSISENPDWPNIIREAMASESDLERLRQREPICDNETEEFSSLQALIYMIGSLLSSNVLVLPVCGKRIRTEYEIAGFKLEGIIPTRPLVINGEQQDTLWIPWAFRSEELVDLALRALDDLVGHLGLRDDGNDFLTSVEEDSERLISEIKERYDLLKQEINRWLLPGGQMKLRFGGDFTICGIMLAELIPGEKVPELSVRVIQNRFGYRTSKVYKLDQDGLFESNHHNPQVRHLILAVNHRVVCWLADYARRPKKYKPKNGETASADPVEILLGEGKLPRGFHLPEYMKLPAKLKKNKKPYEASEDYAKKRCEKIGWALPLAGQTFRMSGDPFQDDLGFKEPIEIIYDV